MVLPLVPLVIVAVTAVTGGAGAGAGVWGGAQLRRANRAIKAQAARYEFHYAAHVENIGATNTILGVLGRTQVEAKQRVILRMTDFLERHAKQVRVHEQLILDGVDGEAERVVGLARLDADVAGWVRGVIGSTIVGVATPAAVRAGVVQLATASTGTAISGLSGAAATSATLAWLGGGALAAGGGGMALGAVMLNVALVGPTALIAGITVKNQGTKARTAAEKHRTEVEVAVAQLQTRNELLRAVRVRAVEVDGILTRLVNEATAALDVLESVPFDIEQHALQLQRTLILVKAARDVSLAPIADEDGNLDEGTAELVLKYREEGKRQTNE